VDQKNLFCARHAGIDKPMTIIVGGGLAGLTCGKVLAAAGRPFALCEAASEPGGRVVSRRTADGYVLDRGFQVLLDSYPTARRHLDFAALGGGSFRAGALFVGRGAPTALENPLHRPAAVVGALRGGPLGWADRWRLLRLVGQALRGWRPPEPASVADLLHRQSFSPEFFERFARPFFGGVLLDPDLETDAGLLLEYLRYFTTGRAALPALGIGAIAAQLAAGLPPESLRYGTRVTELLFRGEGVAGVQTGEGEALRGGKVVLAVDEPALCRLLRRGEPRPARRTAVHYFSAARPFYRGAWLCLPPRRAESPVLHAALLTNAAPQLAPEGHSLWSVTVLPDHPLATDATAVAAEVAAWFGEDAAALTPLDFVRVDYAVPRQDPGFARRSAPWGALPAGVLVAGDATTGASIEAAMASGEAAAKKVISSGAPR